MEGRGKMHGECKRFAEPGCEWRRDRGRTPHTRGNKGVKARAESMPGQEERKKERGKEIEREREPLFVTVSGLSRSIISRKVLLTALIFRLFLPLPCCSFLPFRSVAAPFLFLIVNSARSFWRLSALRHA